MSDGDEVTLLKLKQDLSEEELSIWNDEGQGVEVLASPNAALKLAGAGLDVEAVVEEDAGAMFETEKKDIEVRRRRWNRRRKRRSALGGAKVRFDVNNYHNLEEINQYLRDLEDSYDDVTTEVIGKSFEGRDMVILNLCQGGACGAENKSAIWIQSGIHAREWISPASALFTLDALVQSPSSIPSDFRGLVDRFDWHFLPVVNPDGYAHTWAGGRNWRKTRSYYGNDSVCVGVDLNRNFDAAWNATDSLWSALTSSSATLSVSDHPCGDTYRGTAAWSEPEARNVRDKLVALSEGGRLRLFQDLHSRYSNSPLILYPWSHNCSDSPEALELRTVAKLVGYLFNRAKPFYTIINDVVSRAKTVLRT